jgi:hypothetical protein
MDGRGYPQCQDLVELEWIFVRTDTIIYFSTGHLPSVGLVSPTLPDPLF